MPDRYGEHLEIENRTAEIHANAVTVKCRYCLADIGQPCINQTLPTKPHTRIPHTARVNDSQEVPF